MKNVSLHPIDCLHKNFKQYSSSGDEFMPQDLNSADPQKRAIATEIVLNSFKDAVNVSNANLVRTFFRNGYLQIFFQIGYFFIKTKMFLRNSDKKEWLHVF